MDMRNGLKWNNAKPATFHLGIGPNNEMPEVRDTGIKIAAGFKTIIKVSAMQLESDESIKGLEMRKRGCRFTSESDDLKIFQAYTR